MTARYLPIVVASWAIALAACGGDADVTSTQTASPDGERATATESSTIVPTDSATPNPTAAPTRLSSGNGIRFGDVQLTDQQCDRDPAVSRDGRFVAFIRPADSNCSVLTGSVMIVSTDGSGLREVAPIGASPSWSPDGSSLIFEVFGGNSASECGIYTVETIDINSGAQRIVDGAASLYGAQGPAWSPDGRFLLLVPCVPGQVGSLQVFTLDGQLVRTSGAEEYQYWTSDGHILTRSCLIASPDSDSFTTMPPGTLVLTQTQFPWERPAPSKCEP